MARKDSDYTERPDIEIGASAKADSLRFRNEPKIDVALHGEVAEPSGRDDIDMTSGSERKNLPEEVEPGVTYRDISVSWKAIGRIERDRRDTQKRRNP